MNRKEFLSTVAAWGGAALAASAHLPMLETMADEIIATERKSRNRKKDPSLVVLLADIHICGELADGTPKHYPYNPVCLKLRIVEILSMRPLPAHVLVFGDVAWDYGLEEDYRYAAQLLKELEDAGIRVVLGLGNHDRRAAFFQVFPEYVQATPVPGRAVTVVELPHADIVMLDSLAEKPGLKLRQSTTVSGELDEEQATWLQKFLDGCTRPVILGAHHPLGEMKNLVKIVTGSPAVKGYVYGHLHSWDKQAYIIRPRKHLHMVPTVGLPATFYGDIGFAVLRITPQAAEFEYSSKGFWWPQPVEDSPEEWKARAEDLAHEKCRFLL